MTGKESKRCTRCDKLKDVSEFHKLGKGSPKLQSWCKECNHASMTAYRQRIKDKKLAIKKAAEKILKTERLKVLSAPTYRYENEHTTFLVESIHRQGTGIKFKVQIFDKVNEDKVMGIEMPPKKTEWLRDWLVIKLKEGKNNEKI